MAVNSPTDFDGVGRRFREAVSGGVFGPVPVCTVKAPKDFEPYERELVIIAGAFGGSPGGVQTPAETGGVFGLGRSAPNKGSNIWRADDDQVLAGQPFG